MIRHLSLVFVLAPICSLLLAATAWSQDALPSTLETGKEFPLWPAGKVPESLGSDPVKDVPTLTPYLATTGSSPRAAVIICPGGAYSGLAAHEGKDYGLWLAKRGVVGFVLKYRLGSAGYHHPVMLHDIQRAIRIVRTSGSAWQIDPGRVGVMGSSAGGHLASTAMTHFDTGNPAAEDPVDRASSRPDLGILCYPVISMGPLGHKGSKERLLGPNPSPELVALLSNELQVTKETPTCFIWHTRDDAGVPVENSILFSEALRKAGVPYDLHIYQTGRHGLGLGVHGYDPEKTPADALLPWTGDLAYWLRLQGFIR